VNEEIAIAMHEEERDPAIAKLAQRAGNRCVEFVADVVVASPIFEQVAQDVQRFGLRRRAAQEVEKNRLSAGREGQRWRSETKMLCGIGARIEA
jgi:hypothetical protein